MTTRSRLDLLRLWEVGEGQHPIDRALYLLGAAFPELTWEQLVGLSIGQRDDLLLALRQRIFGPSLATLAECPNCGERLEFTLQVPDLRRERVADFQPLERTLVVEDVAVRYRLPNSADLAALVQHTDVSAAREALLRRCVLESRQGETVLLTADQLPEPVITALAEDMEAADPEAELRLDLECPDCGHQWFVLLDILSYLWTELTAQARHLLRSVHVLARFYGWREADILAMSPQRRQLYLEMVS